MRAWGTFLIGSVGAAAVFAACGDTGEPASVFDGNKPDGSLRDAPDHPPLGDGGPDPNLPDGGSLLNALLVEPADAVLDVESPGIFPSLPYVAKLRATGALAPSPTWFLETPAFGTFDAAGKLTPSGALAGVTRVYAQSGNYYGSTSLTIRLKLRENAANLSDADKTALRAGGTADSAFRWLYPYDKTVFPRDLPPPTLQFGGAAPNALRVTVKSKNFDYEGFFLGSTPGRLAVPASLWKAISLAGGAADPITIGVTKRSAGGGVTGPANETWVIAEGSLKGTVYYNSYKSPLAGGNGVVLRIKPGATVPEIITTDVDSPEKCTVCHSVSANGSVMVAARGFIDEEDAGAYLPPKPNGSESTFIWDLDPDGGKSVRRLEQRGRYTFGGLYPDGSMIMTAGVSAPMIIGPDGGILSGDPYDMQLRGTDQPGPTLSKLIDTKTGLDVPSTGFDNIMAYMPSFSPDGKRIAFVYYNKIGATVDGGRTLGVMDFDPATKTFSNLVEHTEPDVNGTLTRVGWPGFTPDSKRVVYHAGTRFTTHGRNNAVPPRSAYAVMKEFDTVTRTARTLDAMNGYAGAASYLPFETSPATEARMSYEPTMLPVASGGYYWVVFSSRRQYGNLINDPDPFEDPHSSNLATGRRKKMWVSAVEISPAAGTDPSHPAFYLEGQELESGNLRAFWALDPCKATGTTCESGADCCGGFCRPSQGADGGLILTCVPKPPDCAQDLEGCTTDGECCDAPKGVRCIAGHCARPAVPK